MTDPTDAQIHRAAFLIKATAANEKRIPILGKLVEAAQAVADKNAQARNARLNFTHFPDQLAGALELARRSDSDTRQEILLRYRNLLASLLHPMSCLSPRADYDGLKPQARVYLLAPYLKLVVGDAYPMLDFKLSDPTRGVLVYTHTGGPADTDAWRPHLPAISAWLGGNWQLTGSTATTVTLTCRPALPVVIPMAAGYLRSGHMYTGIDIATHAPAYIPFVDMTSGTFIPGASGTGKSNALHILLQSLFANLDQSSHVYLVDGKDGVAFNQYAGKNSKVTVLWEEADLWKLTTELVGTMRDRNAAQREAGTDNATKDFIAVVIDEMSTYTAKPSSDGKSDANKAHARFLDELAMLARRGRSTGLRMIITAQEPTDNQIPTTVRNNCLTTIAFKLPIDAHATATFGQLDGLPADPRKLTRGRALIKHGMTGEMQFVQFPVVTPKRGRP